MRVNGHPKNQETFARISGYVEQVVPLLPASSCIACSAVTTPDIIISLRFLSNHSQCAAVHNDWDGQSRAFARWLGWQSVGWRDSAV